MIKPLFRWTVGNCTQQGLEILEESVFRTMRALGEGNWDWMICHNGLCPMKQNFLRHIVQGKPIAIHEQSWSNCPIDDDAWSPIREDGSIELDGNRCGGTLWKVCPGRMRINAHEVIMDNDLVIMKNIPQLDAFLKSNRTLILEEPIRFYGRYEVLIPLEDRINSGLMGCPPGFDFGARIRKAWEDSGKHTRITQGDEQGLLMYVLQDYPNLRIKKEEVRELMAGDMPSMVSDPNAFAFHFVQANRSNNHRCWLKYKQTFKNVIPFV
jgi:hypothetical protein